MWVKKTSNGKIRYCERYTDYLTGKKKDVSVTFEKDNARNRKEAALLLQELMQNKMAPQEKTLTLSQLVDEYLKDHAKSLSPSTCARDRYSLNSIKRILSEDVLVDRLTARYVQNKFAESGRSAVTLNGFLSKFKTLIRWGYKADLVSSIEYLNKLERFPDVSHRTKIAEKYLEMSELTLLLQKMKVTEWKFLTEFLALSGLRCGEAIALEKSDIDLDKKVIHVTKTYNSNLKIVCPAKTATSADDVYIQPELFSVIKKIQRLMLQQQLIYNYKTKLFFSNKQGDHINYFSYNCYFKENTLAIIGRQLSTHSLRHTHASLLFEQGFTLDEVARRLRHSDSQITKEVYVHVTEKLKAKDAEKMEHTFLLESRL